MFLCSRNYTACRFDKQQNHFSCSELALPVAIFVSVVSASSEFMRADKSNRQLFTLNLKSYLWDESGSQRRRWSVKTKTKNIPRWATSWRWSRKLLILVAERHSLPCLRNENYGLSCFASFQKVKSLWSCRRSAGREETLKLRTKISRSDP